jgi:hypothetical protein
MKKGILKIWLALVVSLVIVAPASATILTVEVTGVVDYFNTEGGFALDGSVGLGSSMAGTTIYDTEAPNLLPPGDNAQYAIISISMTIGNYTFTHDPMSVDPPLFRVFTVDPVYVASSNALRFDGTVYIDSSPKTYDDITWGWTYLELFNLWTNSSEYIPTVELPDLDTWPELSVFDERKVFNASFYDESNRNFQIYGEITSLTPTPEPCTLLLLALGGLALLRKRKIKGTESRFCASY